MSTLLLLAVPHGWAFAPLSGSKQVDLEPQRVLHTHGDEQGRLVQGEAWQRFARTDGRGWQVQFDEATGTPRWMWGRGIPMPAEQGALVETLGALLRRHSDLLGLEGASLRPKSASYVDRIDTWYVEFETLRNGLPTWRGGVSARIKHGNLVLLAVSNAPGAPVTGALVLSADDAVAAAIGSGPAPTADHTERTAVPMLLEQQTAGGLELRTTWKVGTRTQDPPGRWVTFVDGETGEILNVHDEVRYASGTVTGDHHERTLDGSPLVNSPMPYIIVESSSASTNADEQGDYTVNGNGPFSSILAGDYVTIQNDAGGDGFLSDSNADLVWRSGDATPAEIDSYVFLHHVKTWGENTAPEVPWVQGPILSKVNQNQSCNAFFDGTLNFFSAGGGCNNTGQIADVNYHEWGHGFHYYSIEVGTFDGSLSEGAGDTVSFLQTHDPLIAPYFGTNGFAIRDVGPDRRYPGDFTNNAYYVHDNGLIFGGAMYDLMQLLIDDQGVSAGTNIASQIFAGALKGGTDIPGVYFEALVSDDDDGDLENGTPHVCQINDAFGRHGLGGGGTSVNGVLVSHEPLPNQAPDVDAEVAVELVSVSAGCDTVGSNDAEVHFRVDGGEWSEAPMSTSGDSVVGDIPGQRDGSIVEYYVTGRSDEGDTFSSPTGGKINPYSYYVGDTLEIRCDDFEAGDGGYTHELVAGAEADGADDWQWGSPTGQGGDPSGAFSGSKAWGNDLGFDEFNGTYQADKVNRLISPRIETAHYTGVFLQYRRWLQVEDGVFDQAKLTANDQQVWSNWKGNDSEHHLDATWALHTVPLDGIADQGEVRFGFELDSDEGLEFGGWTLDDVCVLAPATVDNRLGITDFVAETTGDTTVRLTWTNPKHRPVAAVRVVRRADRFPESWDDGDIAEEITDPEVGGAVEIEDINGHAGTTFYAVYGSDGTSWLSWTEPGWNADDTELVGGDVPPGEEWAIDAGSGDVKGGCGCDNTPSRTSSLAAALGAAVWLVTRRRRAS